MKVWVFAGGGETEVAGLIPHFFKRLFFNCDFERKTPVRRKPGPKLNKTDAYGKTGKSLAVQIKKSLEFALKCETNSDLILIFDDLDCQNFSQRKQLFENTVNAVLTEAGVQIDVIIAFATPEIEAWFIADWHDTIAKHIDFSNCHHAMQLWLVRNKQVLFHDPESYSILNQAKTGCEHKLSKVLIEATQQPDFACKKIFSKSEHSPILLRDLNADILKQKCPIFKQWYVQLEQFCSESK